MSRRSRFDVDFGNADQDLCFSPRARRASVGQRVPTRAWSSLPYRVYLDSETLVEPVADLTTLRRGDHCMVGLNPVRKVHPYIDAAFTWLATWEIWPLYHHFVMYNDVAYVDLQGVARTQDGSPATICEYSNTPAAALRQLREQGVVHLVNNLAPFQTLPLYDYNDSRHVHGLHRVVRRYSDAERDAIVERLGTLLTEYESYSLWFRNCEHAANAATLSRMSSELHLNLKGDIPEPRSTSETLWVSPQVPHVLFTLMRFASQLVGAFCLYRMSAYCCDMSLIWPWFREAYHIKREVAVYHLFATVPVALQVFTQLLRTVRSLVRKRRCCKLDESMYNHLLGKEIARAVVVGGGATGIIVVLPRLMHDMQLTVRSSCCVLIFAFMTSSLVYNIFASAIIRMIVRVNMRIADAETLRQTVQAMQAKVNISD